MGGLHVSHSGHGAYAEADNWHARLVFPKKKEGKLLFKTFIYTVH